MRRGQTFNGSEVERFSVTPSETSKNEWRQSWARRANRLADARRNVRGLSIAVWQQAATTAVVNEGENPRRRARAAIWFGPWRSTSASAIRRLGLSGRGSL